MDHTTRERNFAAEYVHPEGYHSETVREGNLDVLSLCGEQSIKHFSMSRRGFIGAAMTVAAAAALTSTGCAAKATDKGESYRAGTYSTTVDGRNAPIDITAVFSDSALERIDTDHAESLNVGDYAIQTLTKRCLDAQTLNLDAITGATMTSMAFAGGLENLFKQAGGNVSALKKKSSGVEEPTDINESADVVIVGTGGAALAAATTAVEAGASVIMIEKTDLVGGNSNVGEGTLNAPDPDRQSKQGVEDSVDHYYTDTYEGGDEKGDPALVRILAENSLGAVHFMEDHGLVYEKECFTAIGGKWCRGHAPKVNKKGEAGGAYYVKALLKSCESKGVKIITDAKAEELIYEGGNVTGVKGSRSNGAKVTVKGKSLIMATGGYARNATLAKQFDKRVTDDMPSSNVASSTGDGIVLGQGVGADLMNMELVQIHPLGDPQNGGVATFVGNWLGVEDYLFVNDNALRFIKEDGRRDEIANAILKQPNKEMWLMVDSTNVDDDRLDQIDDLVKTGHSYRADSVADLAKQINIPGDTLDTTVARYNGFIETKTDGDLGKALLGADGESNYEFQDPPYYASKRICTIHYTMGGLKINTNAQVLNTSGSAIPNFYACGECTGGVQGSNRLGGNSYTDLIVFGRIAGASAAANAKKA